MMIPNFPLNGPWGILALTRQSGVSFWIMSFELGKHAPLSFDHDEHAFPELISGYHSYYPHFMGH
jgi:hypothetical protein